jgi:predicted dehydrogenase
MAGDIGFGIIGLGMIADFHTQAIAEMEGCYFAAGFDAAPGRADSFCAEKGGKPYSSLDDFLADPNIQIVTIATPSGLHLDSAIAALNAKKHVIVEKPLEITVERCDAIIACAEKNGVKLGVVFPSRYHAAARLVKEAITSGRLGKITLADAQIKWLRTQEYYDSVKRRGTWDYDGGGVLMNQAIHGIDLLQWFMGDVTEVVSFTATLAHDRIEVEDTAAASLRFANGALGIIEGTTGAYPGFLKKIEVCGTKGSISLEDENIITWQFDEEQPGDAGIRQKFRNAGASGGGAGDPRAINYKDHRLLFEAFATAVRDNKPVDIDGSEGKKSVEIIEAVYRSAKEHKPVTLPLLS